MIINASPLIVFGKINKIDLLRRVLKKIVIAQEVYDEVVTQGLEVQASEASLIAEHISKRDITIKKLSLEGYRKAASLQNMYRLLDKGESETIALALEEQESEVLLDDRTARAVAKLYNLRPRGSLWVVGSAFEKHIITELEVKKLISQMISLKFRLSSEVVAEFLANIEKIKEGHGKKR